MSPEISFHLNQALDFLRKSNLEMAELHLNQALQFQSLDPNILRLLGVVYALKGQPQNALQYLKQSLEIFPSNPLTLSNLGNIFLELREYSNALEAYEKSIKIEPKYFEAWSNKANVLRILKRFDEAIIHYEKALSLKPDYVEALFNKGNTLQQLKRFNEAIICYDKALCLKPDYAEALTNKAVALHELGQLDEAIIYYDKALCLKPDYAEAWSSKGTILHELKRFNEAIIHYDKSLNLKPDYAEGWYNKGVILYELKRFDEAIIHYEKALTLDPDYQEAWSNKGVALHELKRFEEAIIHYDMALCQKPEYAQWWCSKGAALHELMRFDEAIIHYDRALSLKNDFIEAWSNKGNTLNFLKKYSESGKCFLKALQLSTKDSYFLGQIHHQMMLGCDWTNFQNNINDIFCLVKEGRKAAEPFGFQGITNSEELLKKCAEIYSNDKFPAQSNLSEFSQYNHRKIRIGYLCGEFRGQATSILMTRVWELHDKSNFEIFAFDNGWDDGSDYRRRILEAFTRVFDISKSSDLDVAKQIKENQIDILVNLNGFFGLARQGVFSYKPAPIQVNYLGFPGTIGAKYIDYIVADKVVIPEESKIHYVERLVYLPNSYQANDDQRKIARKQFSRKELHLPDNSFIFACFNNNYKITPSTFDSWMRILSCVQGSILWLLADNPIARDNLIKEAVARGIDSSRLVFAERLELSEHLARHRVADLFLDTWPCNAHTTASDALWAGLPVLTLKGNAFAGRVAASLLNAIGLPELITDTQEEYEALAIELANSPQKLESIKLRLAHNRLTTPLFDTPLFTKNLESAYIKMYERYQADLEPDHITIP